MLLHQIPYIAFMALLGVSSFYRATSDCSDRVKNEISLLILILTLGYFYLSYHAVLSYQFPKGYNRPTLNLITSYIYGSLQSFAVGALFLVSLRAATLVEFTIWSLFLLLNSSDFALRLQDVSGILSNTSIFEYGWDLSIAIFCGIVFLLSLDLDSIKKFLTDQPGQTNSIRVLLPGLSLAILGFFATLNLLLSPYFQIATIQTISGHAVIFSIVWIAANIFGIYLSAVITKRVFALRLDIEQTSNLDNSTYEKRSFVELDPIVSALGEMQKRLAKSFEENSKLKAHVAVGELAAQVAHDIRSPLSALQVVLLELDSVSDECRILAKKAISRIQEIANELLDKKRKIIFIWTDLVGLVEDIVAEKNRSSKNSKKIQFEIDFSQRERLATNIQSGQVRRILSNLIDNAIDAIRDSGSVVIEVDTHDKFIRICIKDNGLGVPLDVIDRLGNKGFSYGKLNGNGLGLHHAKTLLESWGGYLKIESTMGKGTRVSIFIPNSYTPEIS